MTKAERELRNVGWIKSAELLKGSGSKHLAMAIKALDGKSFEELKLDFNSDKFRFFNLSSGVFGSGKTWSDLPRE